jgi:hypothetical protein
MSSLKQIAANRLNAQLSTGPASETGKAKSSLNALKTGLTGRTVLLPGEDNSAFEALRAHLHQHFDPVGADEIDLVNRLAETRWRLSRCATLENNLFALGHVEFAGLYDAEAEEVRPALIQAHAFRAYQKEFRNLGIQESRLQRLYDRILDELRDTQDYRYEHEDRNPEPRPKPSASSTPNPPQEHSEPKLRQAAALFLAHRREGRPFDPAQFGFEFSTRQLEQFLQSHHDLAA